MNASITNILWEKENKKKTEITKTEIQKTNKKIARAIVKTSKMITKRLPTRNY